MVGACGNRASRLAEGISDSKPGGFEAHFCRIDCFGLGARLCGEWQFSAPCVQSKTDEHYFTSANLEQACCIATTPRAASECMRVFSEGSPVLGGGHSGNTGISPGVPKGIVATRHAFNLVEKSVSAERACEPSGPPRRPRNQVPGLVPRNASAETAPTLHSSSHPQAALDVKLFLVRSSSCGPDRPWMLIWARHSPIDGDPPPPR